MMNHKTEATQQHKITRPDGDSGDVSLGAWLILAGIFIGIGQLLASGEILTWRIVIGRALLSGGLGMSSTIIFLWFHEIPFFVLLGVACAIVSLGTSGLERAFQAIFNRGPK